MAEKQASEVDADAVERLALAYVAHGATTLLPKHLRLIARMEEFGFFRVGGVLVGTHAFASYANMLGVKWGSSDQTMDVDLAMPGQSISIAVPEAPTVDLHDALSSFEAGFVPTRAFDGKAGATYSLKHDSDIQIDFLTTIDKRGDDPRIIEALAVTAKPLKFLEYAVEAPTQAVALDRNGRHVVINLPSPERYAVHKLIVQGERDPRYKVKAVKDVHQAAALIEHFVANNPRALKEAWGDAYERGPGWRKRLDEGLEALSRSWPTQHQEMKSQITTPTAGKRAVPKKR
ncbi:MAG: nucleotidyltransferase domain-containing protein [Pseudomonadota bacterium]|nr:nucleotidyltransferase domain-containing protein [Pseudomonadota bacterium]